LSITKTTVTEFAAELSLSPAALLKQLAAAGVNADSADASLSAADKGKLLDYLRKQHGGADESAGKRITLTRKSTTELRTADASGKSRTVQVEVRKKRVLVTRAAEAPAAAVPVAAPKAVLSADEIAAREAEAARGNALRERQEKEQQEKQARIAARACGYPCRSDGEGRRARDTSHRAGQGRRACSRQTSGCGTGCGGRARCGYGRTRQSSTNWRAGRFNPSAAEAKVNRKHVASSG
jgi:translation initiation factor IF-2